MDKRGEWKAASGGLDLSLGESPQFTGRALTTLLSNSELAEKRSGDVVVVAELAKELGFTDINGTMPPSIRNLKFILPSFVFPQIEKQTGAPLPGWMTNNIPDYLLPWSVFSSGPPPTVDQISKVNQLTNFETDELLFFTCVCKYDSYPLVKKGECHVEELTRGRN